MNRRSFLSILAAASGLSFLIKKGIDPDVFNRQRASHEAPLIDKKYGAKIT